MKFSNACQNLDKFASRVEERNGSLERAFRAVLGIRRLIILQLFSVYFRYGRLLVAVRLDCGKSTLRIPA